MRVRAVLLAVLVLALSPAAAVADYAHVVAPGETLTSIARIDGLSVAALAHANRISSTAELIAGKILWIPPRGESGKATAVQTATATTQATAATTHAISDQTAAAPAVGRSASAADPQPTAERVSSEEIAAVAAADGVPAALAEAIAWQESGWNNDEVSDVGAVGVMQIVPSTWSWIDTYLTPADPLGTESATENVRAGVLLLHQLLEVTGGNEGLSVAGYFQGLASIREFGMFAATRRYVADVETLARRF